RRRCGGLRVTVAHAARPQVDPAPGVTIRWPSAIESLLAVAAIAALLPLFDRLASGEGRDGRFASDAIAIADLPERALPAVCASHGGLAEPLLRDRLCRRADLHPGTSSAGTMPRVLMDAFAQTKWAFRRPLIQAERRRA